MREARGAREPCARGLAVLLLPGPSSAHALARRLAHLPCGCTSLSSDLFHFSLNTHALSLSSNASLTACAPHLSLAPQSRVNTHPPTLSDELPTSPTSKVALLTLLPTPRAPACSLATAAVKSPFTARAKL